MGREKANAGDVDARTELATIEQSRFVEDSNKSQSSSDGDTASVEDDEKKAELEKAERQRLKKEREKLREKLREWKNKKGASNPAVAEADIQNWNAHNDDM